MKLQKLLDESAESLKILGVGYVQNEFKFGRKYNDATADFTNSEELLIRGGARAKSLGQSFMHDSKADFTNNKLTLELQSTAPYARIHDTGGFIKATPVIDSETGRKTYKMTKFFWYKFYLSKNNFWKILALSSQKKGGVDMKKRPYFSKAIEQIKRKGINIWYNKQFIPNMQEYLSKGVE